VINTILHPISQRFRGIADWVKFSLSTRGT